MLTVLPIRYVADVAATRAFYAGLGLVTSPGEAGDVWALLTADASALGVHGAAHSQGRAPGTVELGLLTDEPLDDVAARLAGAGYACELVEENFGRSVRVTDPDGVVVQIQHIDPEVVRRSEDAARG